MTLIARRKTNWAWRSVCHADSALEILPPVDVGVDSAENICGGYGGSKQKNRLKARWRPLLRRGDPTGKQRQSKLEPLTEED